MSYEVIDEEQKIAACNVADLTASQAVSFFKENWGFYILLEKNKWYGGFKQR